MVRNDAVYRSMYINILTGPPVPTQDFVEELSDVPLLSLQDGISLFPVVRLLGDRRCQEAGQTQR